MQTIQQLRAKYALDQVQQAIKNEAGVDQKEYKSYASALPAMIHTNGLGQAVAFFKSKGGTHGQLYTLLSNWLCGNGSETPNNQPYQGSESLLKGITENDMHTYRLAQAEAQAIMEWVKQFANAYMSSAGGETKNKAPTGEGS